MIKNKLKKVITVYLMSLSTTILADANPVFTEVWRSWHSGAVGTNLEKGAEIAAYDTASKNIFVTNW